MVVRHLRHAAVERHGRAQVKPAGLFGREHAVEQQAGAHHVEVHLGIVNDSAAVGAMADGEVVAGHLLHALDRMRKARKLQLRVRVAVFVRDGKVREHACEVQVRQRKRLDHLIEVAVVVHVKARAAHAGLELHVRVQPQAGTGEKAVELACIFDAADRLRHAERGQIDRNVRRLRAEQQDVHRHTGGAQLLRLVIAVDGHPLAARLLQPLRHTHRAVAVGIGLADAEHLAAVRQTAADLAIIVFQVIETDLYPGSDLAIHRSYFLVPDSSFLWCSADRACHRPTAPRTAAPCRPDTDARRYDRP